MTNIVPAESCVAECLAVLFKSLTRTIGIISVILKLSQPTHLNNLHLVSEVFLDTMAFVDVYLNGSTLTNYHSTIIVAKLCHRGLLELFA